MAILLHGANFDTVPQPTAIWPTDMLVKNNAPHDVQETRNQRAPRELIASAFFYAGCILFFIHVALQLVSLAGVYHLDYVLSTRPRSAQAAVLNWVGINVLTIGALFCGLVSIYFRNRYAKGLACATLGVIVLTTVFHMMQNRNSPANQEEVAARHSVTARAGMAPLPTAALPLTTVSVAKAAEPQFDVVPVSVVNAADIIVAVDTDEKGLLMKPEVAGKTVTAQNVDPSNILQSAPIRLPDQQPEQDAEFGWLTQSPGHHYTIQLLATSNEKYIIDFIERYQLREAKYYRQNLDAGKWLFKLIHGEYVTRAAAIQALSGLGIAGASPWIRQLRSVRKEVDTVYRIQVPALSE